MHELEGLCKSKSFGDSNWMGVKWRSGSIADRRPNVIPPRGLPRNCGLDSEPLDIFFIKSSHLTSSLYPSQNQPPRSTSPNFRKMLSTTLSTNIPVDKGFSPSYRHFKERYDLEGLVQDIKKHLGESGGISSDEVDEAHLISLLKKYVSDPSDWIDYFYNDTSKNYTRNAIENINHKANIVSPAFAIDILVLLQEHILTEYSFFSYGTRAKAPLSTTMPMLIAS